MFWTAFLLGLTGSLHCAGMCSPLAMAVTSGKPLLNKFLYNVGRITTYGFLGASAAALGRFTTLSAYSSVASVFLGIMIILIGMGLTSGVSLPGLNRIFQRFAGWIRKIFGWGLQQKTYISTFLLGMANGLVPCGISALALMYCFILPDAQSGFLSMWVFGLGTWPVMILFPLVLQRISGWFQFNVKKVTIVAMAFSGLLMIGNGIWSEHSVISSEGQVIPIEVAICP